MTASGECYLQGKTFYGRDWVFQKLTHCLNCKSPKNPPSDISGVLVVGSAGTGKTALCAELVAPTVFVPQKLELSERILAHHFCQTQYAKSLKPGHFVCSLANQVLTSSLIGESLQPLIDDNVRMLLDEHFCSKYPMECADALAKLLGQITPPSEAAVLLIDSIHELVPKSCLPRSDTPAEASPAHRQTDKQAVSIASILGRIAPRLPDWLLLVCTARRFWPATSRTFSGFRKIVLDDLKKAAVVRDSQNYILRRIDEDIELYELLIQKAETAELLNQLNIKSAGCILYLEKILDGLVDGLLKLTELADIPGTLNGLYLWLCQRIFSKKQFELVRPALNALLAARSPLTPTELRSCWVARHLTANPALFDQVIMKLLNRVLVPVQSRPDRPDRQTDEEPRVMFFHNSFAEWLRDVKHCTQRYLCSFTDGQHSLAMFYSSKASSLDADDLVHFCQCLDRAMPKTMESAMLQAWLLSSGANPSVYTIPVLDDIPKVFHPLFTPSPLRGKKDTEILSALSLIGATDNEQSHLTLDGRTSQLSSTYSTSAQESTLDTLIQAAREGWDARLRAMLGGSDPARNQAPSGLNPNCTDGEGWSALRGASWAGHLSTVELLLDSGAEVDYADGTGRTALRAAAWAGHENVVEKLLDRGADINKTDAQGRTALMAASYMGHLDIVRILLVRGANADVADTEGRTALALAVLGCAGLDTVPATDLACLLDILLNAAKNKNDVINTTDQSGGSLLLSLSFEGPPEACATLISHGADPDLCSGNLDGWYPVHAAASTGNLPVLDVLLEQGASIDAIDHEGRTALSLAAAGGKADMVKSLLERGQDELHRDNHGWIPLHLAALENKPEVVRVLCEHNPSTISEVDREGRHPLILAAEEQALESAEALLEFNPPVDLASLSGHTPLRVACLTKHKPISELLMARGADPDVVDLDGRSTLFVMILQKSAQFAEFLLSHGSSPESKDLMGRTPLHVAAYLGEVDLVDMLLKWGANVNATDQAKRTPLVTATWQGEVPTCKLLLDYSAKPDLSCKEGATPLHVAAQLGREDLVRTLLQYNADHTLTDSFGRNAAAVAAIAGQPSIAALLNSRETQQTNTSQTSTQESSGIGSTGYSTVESPYHTMGGAQSPGQPTAPVPIDHIIPDDSARSNALERSPKSKDKARFNTHSSSLSNYTLSSSASLGSNPDQAAMDGSALFSQCLLERSLSQQRAKEVLGGSALNRSAYSEPNGGAISPTGLLYRSRPRIITNPRCRRKASPVMTQSSYRTS